MNSSPIKKTVLKGRDEEEGEPGGKKEGEGGQITVWGGGEALHKRLHGSNLCIGKITDRKQMCGCRRDTPEI